MKLKRPAPERRQEWSGHFLLKMLKRASTHPTEEEFEAIFNKVCEANKIEFKKDAFDYLVKNYYKKLGTKFNSCHARDFVDQIIDDANYYNHPAEMTRESLTSAWEDYFLDT